jgi:3-oxoacyl-[acyl-carrier-protein] synthase II
MTGIFQSGNDSRRVVITGMGVIAPNGRDLDTFWNSIVQGQSTAAPLTRFDPKDCACRLAAEIKDWDPAEYIDPKLARRSDRSLQYALAASKLAAQDANLDLGKIDPDRVGVVEATSVSNLESAYRARDAITNRGPRGISPSMMVGGYVGSGSAEIAHSLGSRGHAITCSSSSASGNDAMGYALHMIQHEDIDVMVAGGAEAPLVDTLYFGFAHVQAMSRWSGSPSEAMKPFDTESDGFVMGEGAAYVVMEELTHALSRGAKVYAEVVAQSRACEAYHAMAPHPDGWGVARAMSKCLRAGQVDLAEIDYINVHGTGNEPNDIAETRAIKTVFGSRARSLAVTATKPITGHALAAAGAIETVICVLAIHRSIIPPTINLKKPFPECDLDYVPDRARPYPIRSAMSLNSGFGGKTSCLLLRRYQP